MSDYQTSAHQTRSGTVVSEHYPYAGHYQPPVTEPAPGGAAPPPVPPDPRTGPGDRRPFGRVIVLIVAALVLMAGSGLAGGWVATRLDNQPTPADTASGGPTPEFDRSSLSGVVAQAQDSVVSIQAGGSGGSGVVLDTDGHVLTNNHVVANAGGEVTVTLNNGESREAAVVGTDPRSDLAVVRLADTAGLVPASLGDSDALEIGDTVLAIGSPLGLEGSVTSGIISAKNRTIQVGDQQPFERGTAASISGMLQTDAAINPGNSGGALINTAGEVIGINTAIATGGGDGNGVGFAIPSNTVARVAEQLINGETVAHAYLGVSIADADGGGALLQSVEPGGPADQAGLQPADVVTAVDGEAVRDSDGLVAAVQSAEVGQQVEITYLRDGTEQTTTATLADAP